MQTEYDLTPEPDNPTRRILIFLGGCLGLLACIICVGITAVVGYFTWQAYEQEQGIAQFATDVPIFTPTAVTPTATPTFTLQYTPSTTEEADTVLGSNAVTPTAVPTTTLPVPRYNLDVPPEIDQSPIPERAFDDLERFLAADFPYRDYYEVAKRLGNYNVGERTTTRPEYHVGDTQTFKVDNEPLYATLAGVTDHAYFWVENGIELDKTAVVAAANYFETDYYPLITNLFGTVWTPGIDNDPRFTLLHMIGSVDAIELGYFTDVNEYPTTIYSDSNEQEMIYLNMAQMDVGSALYFGTLVHEIQHLIQWHMDANETAWLNEGLSQLAEIYVGLETATTEEYLYYPETPLNDWSYDSEEIDAHYAAAYLFAVYIWEQLGDTAVQELARHPANGLAAVNSVLQGYAPDRSLADFTADFAAANYVRDLDAGERYYYEHLHTIPPSSQIYLNDVPLNTIDWLDQFSVHYATLDFSGSVNIQFAGNTVATVIDAPPPQAEQMWLAPPQSDTDAKLTAVVDLTAVNQAMLRFNTWYDLEEQWDFAYITLSTDEGATWQILSSVFEKAGEYGVAWNGRSDQQNGNDQGWLKETVSLNEYVGQQVWLRFEVVTDVASNGRGFALSNITIPELESHILDWTAEGFVQTGWQLPQQWRVRLIQKGGNGLPPQVLPLPLDDLNQGQWLVDIGPNGAVLVITPLTPFMDQPATYWLNIGK
jgi:hypothetical protein